MHKYFFNNAIKILKSSIFIALIGSFFLLGCKKEITEVIKNDSESTSFNVQPSNSISIDEAQNWFSSQFGKFKEVSSNPPVANFSSTDAYYFSESFRIEPIWPLAKQSTYMRRNPITIVPVQPIAFLDAKDQKYALVFYRDSLNRLQSKLQVYAAIESYKRENAKEKVKNFSGIMYQVDYSGLVHHVFAAKNGRLIQKFSLGANRNSGQIVATPRGCFGLGPSIFEELWCVLQHVFDGGGGWNPNVDVNIHFNVPTPINYNLDLGQLPSGGGGGGSTTNNNIDTQIDDTLFDTGDGQVKRNYYQGLYVLQMGFVDTDFEELYNDKRLFTQVERYFALNGRSTDNINTIKQHHSMSKTYPQYAQANINAKYPLSVLVSLPYFNKANFSETEFVNIFSYSSLSVFLPIQRLLADPRLTELEKISALKEFKSEIDWNNIRDNTILERSKDRDIRLDLSNLENNAYFNKLTTGNLRDRIRIDYPSLESWQVNISAGVALENAYAYFSGYKRPGNTPVFTETTGAPKFRITRPDFHHATLYEDLNTGEKVLYPYAGKIEVKVSQNPIKLSTNKWQIAAEIAMSYAAAPEDEFIRMAKGENPIKHAGHSDRKAGSFTLVLPYGATHDTEIEAECTRLNVNFYVSYAFIGQNGEVVFSNPQRKNNIIPESKPGTGTLDKGSILDFEKSTVYWRDNQRKNNLKNETNNALDGTE